MNKTRRLNRILARDGKALIVAMDHGAIQGPKGLERPGEVISKVAAGGADAILTTYGIARVFGKELAPVGLIIRTDGGASTIGPDVSDSAGLYSVEDAPARGRRRCSLQCRARPQKRSEAHRVAVQTFFRLRSVESRARGRDGAGRLRQRPGVSHTGEP